MTWHACQLEYEMRSPLLLGGYKLGFIQRTRLFIPGWTLWGALTAKLAPYIFHRPGAAEYEICGEFIEKNLRTSYGWLLLDGQECRPKYTNNNEVNKAEWYYGKLRKAELENRVLGSRGQNTVDPNTFTTLQNGLFETEMINEYDCKEGKRNRWCFILYYADPWLGDYAAPFDTFRIADALKQLEKLNIGADRSSGFGWLRRIGKTEEKIVEGDEAGPYPLDWKNGPDLYAHVPVQEICGKDVLGKAEPVPRRVWENDSEKKKWGPGQKMVVECFYTPGSRLKEKKSWQPLIGPKGIWLSGGQNVKS